MSTYTYQTCDECTGRGLVAAGESVAKVCQKCNGIGVCLSNEQGVQFQFKTTPYITPQTEAQHGRKRILRYGLAASILLIFLISTIVSFSEIQSLDQLIWQRGILRFVMGVSGLLSMYALTLFEHHQTSVHTLNTLPETSPIPVDLFDYANPRLKELLGQAAYAAEQKHTDQISDDILLGTLFLQPRIQSILARLELPLQDVISEMQARIAPGHTASVSHAYFTAEARERYYQAFHTAFSAHFPYIDLEDLLLAYMRDPKGHAAFFKKHGLTEEDIYAVSRWYAEDQDRNRQWAFWRERGRSRPSGFMNKAWTALPTPFLDRFSVDITAQAASGNVRSADARKLQIDRALEILGATSQNSVILLGEPGVGKSTMLGGIALRMIEDTVPEVLRDKRLVQLDAQTLLASDGAEEHVQQIIAEVAQAGNVILAIPDLHVLSANPGAAITPATLLANALTQGILQIVSTATYSEYHSYLENVPAITNAVTIIEVPPATAEQTLRILEEEAPNIEAQYNLRLTFHALEAAVELAERFLPDQLAPSGALTLLGDAASGAQQRKQSWVRRDDVEQAIEKRTSIPVREADGAEKQKLLDLETNLHTRVIGQEQAIEAVADALRRSRAGLTNKKKPIASFLFVGPTGVGKTETAKAVADLLFGEHGHFIRFDMSEFQDPSSIYQLIGAPTGAGTQAQGGALTQAVREHPYSLILFDELEKADSHVLDLFLQLLDDGRLTDNAGRTVHFQNCLIVATSNAGSKEIMKLMQEKVSPDQLPKQVLSLLQNNFKPEFLNRFDAIVPFRQLTESELSKVVILMLAEVITKAAEQGVTLEFSEDAIAKIAKLGYDPLYGARPLRRVIQDKVEGLLATLLLQNSIDKSQPLRITAEMVE